MNEGDGSGVPRAWGVFGTGLGIVLGLAFLTDARPLFAQLGIVSHVLNVVAWAVIGHWVTMRYPPTRKTLAGLVVFPIIWAVCDLVALGFGNLTPFEPLFWLGGGALAGILAANAWQGALIGALLGVLVSLVRSEPVTIDWRLQFIPLGAFLGALMQALIADMLHKPPRKRGNDLPHWLRGLKR